MSDFLESVAGHAGCCRHEPYPIPQHVFDRLVEKYVAGETLTEPETDIFGYAMAVNEVTLSERDANLRFGDDTYRPGDTVDIGLPFDIFFAGGDGLEGADFDREFGFSDAAPESATQVATQEVSGVARDGWIEWGGERRFPEPIGTYVEVRTRGGSKFNWLINPDEVGAWDWSDDAPDHDFNFVAYRVVERAEAQA